MALIDVVKYQGSSDEFVWKFPSNDLRLGSQLVVNTKQTAFFVKSGKIYDQYSEGTRTLTSGNIPLLNKLINLPFGGDSPFQAEVWYVNLISILDNKWGTPTPIQVEDPKYNIVVPVRAFGQFGMSIEDPRKFLETVVGNMTSFSTQKVVEYFKGKIVSTITSALGKKLVIDGISVLQMHLLLDDLSDYCKNNIVEEFSNYGIKIENFYFMSINIPENDPSLVKLKEAKDLAAKVNIAGKDVYQMDRSFDVMEKAAGNEGTLGGVMGAGMGAGMGMGLGFGMGNQMGGLSNAMNPVSHANNPPPPPNSPQFFVLINNQQNGPHTIDSIKNLIETKQISRDTLVWRDGMEEWGSIVDQEELLVLFSNTPPPPPIGK